MIKRVFNRCSELEKRRHLRKRMTDSERILYSVMKNNGIMGKNFIKQYSVDGFVIDFYNRECKLAIEIDGSFHDIEGASEYDFQRQQIIEQYGIQFLRFTNEEVMNDLSYVTRTIKNKLYELGSPQE